VPPFSCVRPGGELKLINMPSPLLRRCFISYRWESTDDIDLLERVMHEHGIRTWRDIDNLRQRGLRDELGRVIDSDDIASAIIYVSPGVKDSEIIRHVEVPALIERGRNHDFPLLIFAADLDHREAISALGPAVSNDHFVIEVKKKAGQRVGRAEAARLTKMILSELLKVHDRHADPKERFRLEIDDRQGQDHRSDAHLLLDWSRLPSTEKGPTLGAFRQIIQPTLRRLGRSVRNRSIEVGGRMSFSSALAVGLQFKQVTGCHAIFQGHGPKGKIDIFDIRDPAVESGFRAEVTEMGPGPGIALVFSVTHHILDAVNDMIRRDATTRAAQRQTNIGTLIHIRPDPDPGLRDFTRTILTGPQTLDLVEKARKAATAAVPTKGRTLHLFFAAPVGLAFLFGQLANTSGTIIGYEHIPSGDEPYIPGICCNGSIKDRSGHLD
jgi:hypothetical protein